MFNKWLAHCSPQRKKSLIQWIDVNLGSPDRNSTLLKCHFLRLSDKARAGAGRRGGLRINIFPRRSISLVRPNGCLPAPCGRESPSGQKQIKAHTLQIGGLPQLARRLEFSTALTEKSVSFLLPISLSPCFKRKSHPLHTSGPPPALPSLPLRWPGSGLEGSEGGGVSTLASIPPTSPQPIALRTGNCQPGLIYKTDLPSEECNYAQS